MITFSTSKLKFPKQISTSKLDKKQKSMGQKNKKNS
jgi:hypothetical protein